MKVTEMNRLLTLFFIMMATSQVSAQAEKIRLTVGGRTFTATLEQNQTAQAFARLLPRTLNMSELNGNEKYHYLSENLPTSAANPGTIHEGDLMLYGASCVVLFYKTFQTSYSYTRIGHIDDPSGLRQALGSGSVSVAFAHEETTNVRTIEATQSAQRGHLTSGMAAHASAKGIVISNGTKTIRK